LVVVTLIIENDQLFNSNYHQHSMHANYFSIYHLRYKSCSSLPGIAHNEPEFFVVIRDQASYVYVSLY